MALEKKITLKEKKIKTPEVKKTPDVNSIEIRSTSLSKFLKEEGEITEVILIGKKGGAKKILLSTNYEK